MCFVLPAVAFNLRKGDETNGETFSRLVTPGEWPVLIGSHKVQFTLQEA